MAGPVIKARKSPIEHTVHRHTRKGKWVEDFQRGKGKALFSTRAVRSRPKKTVIGSTVNSIGMVGDYRVRLLYKSNPNENFKLTASSFQDAQRSGFNRSSNVEHPLKVSVRRI